MNYQFNPFQCTITGNLIKEIFKHRQHFIQTIQFHVLLPFLTIVCHFMSFPADFWHFLLFPAVAGYFLSFASLFCSFLPFSVTSWYYHQFQPFLACPAISCSYRQCPAIFFSFSRSLPFLSISCHFLSYFYLFRLVFNFSSWSLTFPDGL